MESDSALAEYSLSPLEQCLSKLRDILGPSIPVEELVQIAEAADFDANRALNHYFAATQVQEGGEEGGEG